MGCITLVRCVLVLRCDLAVVVWYPYAGFSLHMDICSEHYACLQMTQLECAEAGVLL